MNLLFRGSETSYYLGTTKENRTITFSVMLINITLQKYRQFVSWVSNNSNANNDYILKFDYNEFFGYKVKLNSLGDGNFTVNPDCDTNNLTYNVEVDLEFITFNDWEAQYISEVEFNLLDSLSDIDYANGLFIFEGTNTATNEYELEITNSGTVSIFLNIEFNSSISLTSNFDIYKNNELWYRVDRKSNYTIYGKYGIILDSSNIFYPYLINQGILEIPVGTTIIKNIFDREFCFKYSKH